METVFLTEDGKAGGASAGLPTGFLEAGCMETEQLLGL